MMKKIVIGKVFLQLVLVISVLFSMLVKAEDINIGVVGDIRSEGFNRSQIMDTLSHLSDTIGPRLSGSPAMLEANRWTKEKLEEWGLQNAKLEAFDFGPGWTPNETEVYMVSPRRTKLSALPIAWLPGTDGEVSASAIYAPMEKKEDFEKYKGKLAGKIVFVDEMPILQEVSNKIFKRHDDKSLTDIRHFKIPAKGDPKTFDEELLDFFGFIYDRDNFLAAEGAVAMVRRPEYNGFINSADNYQHLDAIRAKTPGVSIVSAHYDRAVRIMEKDQDVKLSLDIDVTFHEDDKNGYSTIAEIPGKGRNPEIVMLGAHLDSWFAGDGAVDNGAGVAVVMEAVRILKALDVDMKRTVRIGLWGGEEQGLHGSMQYVNDHLAERSPNTDKDLPAFMSLYKKTLVGQLPVKKKKDYQRFSVYFNVDHGSGKIRGIYAEQNTRAAKIFEQWFSPFHDLGAQTVVLNTTDQTDHVTFDEVGLPGFQFIQDPLDYFSRLHHTQMDMYNYASEKDLKQAAVIVASFVYHAATRDDLMPRKKFTNVPPLKKTVTKN